MYSKETENCLYSHLSGKTKVSLVSEKRARDPESEAAPVSRGWLLLQIQTKIIFYCSYIQCNTLLYLPAFRFLARPSNKLNLQANRQIVSDFYLRARLTCKQPVPAFHSHLDEFVSSKQEAISSTEYIGSSAQLLSADSQQLDSTNRYSKIYSASVPMCNVAALTFMQLFMTICVVVVFLKKGMYVPGTAIDVCIVLNSCVI